MKGSLSNRKGFTLIEILVVIGLIALIMSIAIPNLNLALKVNISNSSQELATTIRSAYDESILKGQVHRIVLDLDKKQYWVEIGEKNFLLKTEEQKIEENRKQERLTKEERAEIKDPFTLARKITKKKKDLPRGVRFTGVQTSQSKESITKGIVYAHIFPHGFIEKLEIHLKDDFDREATLLINSASGKSRVFNRNVKND